MFGLFFGQSYKKINSIMSEMAFNAFLHALSLPQPPALGYPFLCFTDSHKVLKKSVNTQLLCQNNQRVIQSSALSHPFSSAYDCQNEWMNERETEIGREMGPHITQQSQEALGSFSSVWIHSTHPSTHLTVLKPQHLSWFMLCKNSSM